MKSKQLLLFASAALAMTLASCGGNNSSSSPAKSEGSSASSQGGADKSSEPASSQEPTVTSEPKVYYTVTFDLNYEGSEPIVLQVEAGQYATEPNGAVREGYGLTGWFTEAACENEFDFATPIEANLTLYAGWLEINENTRTATFHLNDGSEDDVYTVVYFEAGKRVTKPADPVMEGYNFRGWFNEATCETEWRYAAKYSENIDVYAKWFAVYTWEAEYTQLTDLPASDVTANEYGDKIGHGYSSDVSGTGLIFPDSEKANCDASNGYFIADLYYNGAYLEFDVTSDKDVDDAVLIARLSAEYFDMIFAPSKDGVASKDGPHGYDFIVNDVALDYGTITLDGVPTGRDDASKRKFTNHTLSSSVSLKEGKNVIKLVTKNSNRQDGTGTMAAMAPMVDCLYCYSDAELEFDAWTENIDE